jgi:hypothetical protein
MAQRPALSALAIHAARMAFFRESAPVLKYEKAAVEL